MRRDVESLLRRVREELRAEGPDGGGWSDFFLLEAMNAAQADLAEEFPIRDILSFQTEDKKEYDLKEKFPDTEIENILRVTCAGTHLYMLEPDAMLQFDQEEDMPVRYWFLWGNILYLVGNVEKGESVKLYVTRAPYPLTETQKGVEPEMPYYADEALVHYAVSAAFRESRDYDRANFYYELYTRAKQAAIRRGTPQRQRDGRPVMRDTYWPPVGGAGPVRKTDTNPGGRVD